MKRKFENKRFTVESKQRLEWVDDILNEYAAEGYDLSVRQLYYQLVARGLIENSEKSYNSVKDLVNNGRLAGLIDWDIIKDRGRSTVEQSHWDSPADIVESAARQFRVDRWANQPRHVEVMVEKQALEGVIIPVCAEWDVPFTANKGYSSSSTMYETGQRLARQLSYGKEVVIIYLGDHDPSGMDMTRDVEERSLMFSGASFDAGDALLVDRAALNMDQIHELDPPENPAKMTDVRAPAYVARYGHSSWELDAIEPRKLAELVGETIAKYVDDDAWEETGKVQAEGRRWLTKMARDYKEDNE